MSNDEYMRQLVVTIQALGYNMPPDVLMELCHAFLHGQADTHKRPFETAMAHFGSSGVTVILLGPEAARKHSEDLRRFMDMQSEEKIQNEGAVAKDEADRRSAERN